MKARRTINIERLGDLRILAIIKDNDMNTVGYVIMAEKERKIKVFSVVQTEAILNRYKVVNAYLDNDNNIKFRDCSESRMFMVDRNFTEIKDSNAHDNKLKVMVIGEVAEEKSNRTVGYIIVILNDIAKALKSGEPIHTVELSESDIVKEKDSNKLFLVNAKIVDKGNNAFVSSLKDGTFAKFIKKEVKEEDKNTNNNEYDKWRKKRYLEKLSYRADRIIEQYLLSTLDEEELPKKFRNDNKRNAILDKEIAKRYTSCYNEISKIFKKLQKGIDKTLYRLVFFYGVKDIEEEKIEIAVRKIMRSSICHGIYDKQKSIEVACDSIIMRTKYIQYIIDTLSEFKEFTRDKEAIDSITNKVEKIKRKKLGRIRNVEKPKAEFTQVSDFCTDEEVAEIGFTITEKNEGQKIITKDKRYLTLRSFKKEFNELARLENTSENTIKDIIYNEHTRNFGDLYVSAAVIKLLDAIDYANKCREEFKGWYYEARYEKMAKECKLKLQVIIALGAIFNSYTLGNILKFQSIRDRLNSIGIREYEEYNEYVNEEFIDNDDELWLYFKSGFNVFSNDGSIKGLSIRTKSYIDKAEYVNLRPLRYLEFSNTVIKEDLVAIIKLSGILDNMSENNIKKVIGNLRVF